MVASVPVGPSKTDILTSEVLSYLELIQNGNKDMIQKAMDSLNLWQPNEQDEIELELNVELWCRLGRLAINQNTNAMFKVALYCADVAIKCTRLKFLGNANGLWASWVGTSRLLT